MVIILFIEGMICNSQGLGPEEFHGPIFVTVFLNFNQILWIRSTRALAIEIHVKSAF